MARHSPTFGQVFFAALIGGVSAGVLSFIPYVSALNCVCCAWVILGGMLTGFVLTRFTQNGVTMGEGIAAGGFSGVLAGVIYWTGLTLIAGPFVKAAFDKQLLQMPEQQRQIIQQVFALMMGPAGAIFCTVIYGVMGLLGGLFAALIWKPQPPVGYYQPPTPPQVPPPPPPPAAPPSA